MRRRIRAGAALTWAAGGNRGSWHSGAAPTGAEPVVTLPLVVHLHHAHEVEVLDLPMGTHQWQVTTCTEPAQGPNPGKGEHADSPAPPTSATGNALNALETNSFSLAPPGDKGHPCQCHPEQQGG